MAGLGNAYKNHVLDAVFGSHAAPYTPPANYWVELYTVTPTSAGGGTAVTGGAYARVEVANDLTHFPLASGGGQPNGVPVTFLTATADWGTVVAFAYHDDPTADSVVSFGSIGTPVDIPSGTTAQFDTGALVATAA
jgi:hypothetical protein